MTIPNPSKLSELAELSALLNQHSHVDRLNWMRHLNRKELEEDRSRLSTWSECLVAHHFDTFLRSARLPFVPFEVCADVLPFVDVASLCVSQKWNLVCLHFWNLDCTFEILVRVEVSYFFSQDSLFSFVFLFYLYWIESHHLIKEIHSVNDCSKVKCCCPESSVSVSDPTLLVALLEPHHRSSEIAASQVPQIEVSQLIHLASTIRRHLFSRTIDSIEYFPTAFETEVIRTTWMYWQDSEQVVLSLWCVSECVSKCVSEWVCVCEKLEWVSIIHMERKSC